MTEKIQFFMSDLAWKLDIGEIKEIHVAEQNGRKVLRIECEKKETSEYKTVRASKSAKPAPVAKKKEPADKPETFAEKAVAATKDFFLNSDRNKNKPFWGGRTFGGGMF